MNTNKMSNSFQNIQFLHKEIEKYENQLKKLNESEPPVWKIFKRNAYEKEKANTYFKLDLLWLSVYKDYIDQNPNIFFVN